MLTCWQSQVHELKQAQTAEGSQLHRMLVDPAINLVFSRMKSQLSDYKEKLEQAQTDLSAWKFTPDRLETEGGFTKPLEHAHLNLPAAALSVAVCSPLNCFPLTFVCCVIAASVNFYGHSNSWLRNFCFCF